MKKYLFLLVFLCTVSLFAKDYRIEKPKECITNYDYRFALKHREERGVGYQKGYSTAQIYLSNLWRSNCQPFLVFTDVRFHVFNDARFACNAGVGTRLPTYEDRWIFGANFYYDYRQSKHLKTHQVAGGMEVLSNWVDFRVNGYLPVAFKRRSGPFVLERLAGNNIFLKRRLDFAFPSVQGEIGFPIPGAEIINLYAALGPYYLFNTKMRDGIGGSSGNTWGGKIRLKAQVYEGIGLGIDYTFDTIFHSRVQGYAIFSFPIGPSNTRKGGSNWKRKYTDTGCQHDALAMAMLNQDVERNEIIPVIEKKQSDIPLINPVTGLPFNFIVVNNLSSSSGTFEDPFGNLAEAQAVAGPNDIIYVFPGDGTTTGYESGFIMSPGQTFAGSGFDLRLDGFVFPAQTPGQLPKVTKTAAGGAAIVVANSTLVQGIDVFNPPATTSGITGTGVSNVMIANNIVRSTENCVHFLTGGNSNINVTNNIIIGGNAPFATGCVNLTGVSGTCNVSNNVMQDTKGAITVSQGGTSSGNFAFMHNNCITSGNPFTGIDIGLSTTGSNSFNIVDNVIDGGAAVPSFSFVDTGIGIVRQTLTSIDNVFGGMPLTVANASPDSVCMNMRNTISSGFDLHNLVGAPFTIQSPSQAAFEASNFGGPFTYTPGVGSFTFSTMCP